MRTRRPGRSQESHQEAGQGQIIRDDTNKLNNARGAQGIAINERDKKRAKTSIFHDLDCGTFGVSTLVVGSRVLDVVAASGGTHLGSGRHRGRSPPAPWRPGRTTGPS